MKLKCANYNFDTNKCQTINFNFTRKFIFIMGSSRANSDKSKSLKIIFSRRVKGLLEINLLNTALTKLQFKKEANLFCFSKK
jgi:hypothetical protein